jgi:hypothetical protein
MAFDRIWGDRATKIAVLDTSAILMLFEFSIDLEDELSRLIGSYKVIIPKPIVDELIFLSKKGKGKKQNFAKASLKLIEKYDVIDVNGERGDDSVLALAKKFNCFLVTNDRELKKRAKREGLHTIFLRKKGKLDLD